MNYLKTESTSNSNKTYYNCPYKLFEIENNKVMLPYTCKKQKCHPFQTYSNSKGCLFTDIANIKKKLKSVTLSNQMFNDYMNNYTNFTQNHSFKSPSDDSYPLKKNHRYLSLNNNSYRNNNKKTKLNFFNVTEDQPKSIKEEPYGFKYGDIKIFTKNAIYRNQEKLKSKFFCNFCDDDVYVQKDKNVLLFEQLGLNYNIDYDNSEAEKKSNYDYLFKCLLDLHKLNDYTDNKSIDYNIKTLILKKTLDFKIEIFSLCLKFNEINNKNEKQISHRIFLPFKLLPLYYLLDFETMKIFISEILYYDTENDCISLNNNTIFRLIYKYCTFVRSNMNNENYLKNINFNKNDVQFQKEYLWITSGNSKSDNTNGNKIYKLKIVLPKIKFNINDKTNLIKFLNRHILTKIIKNNFNNWDKLVLYELFTHKKFKNIINNFVLDNDIPYMNRKIFLDRININNMKIKSNYEFYLSEKGDEFSNYYLFVPFILLIVSGEENKTFQKIELNLNESQNLKKFSKYWGIINTLLKCMYINSINHKIFFKLNLLENISEDLISVIQTQNFNPPLVSKLSTTKNLSVTKSSGNVGKTWKSKEDLIKYVSKDLEIIVLNCSLKKIIVLPQKRKNKHYRIPLSLQDFFFDKKNMGINYEIGSCIARCSYEITNAKEENITAIETRIKERIIEEAELKKKHALDFKRKSTYAVQQKKSNFNDFKNTYQSRRIKTKTYEKFNFIKTKTMKEFQMDLKK